MKVNQFIIHRLLKEQGSSTGEIKNSTKLSAINSTLEITVDRLNKAFSLEGKVIKTKFIEDVIDFGKDYTDCFSSENTVDNFLKFTIKTSKSLLRRIKQIYLAGGGYVVYTVYTYKNNKYLGIFLVRESKEILFKENEKDDNYEVLITTIINSDKLALAARINITESRSESEDRYLALTNKQDSQSEYFSDWLEADLSEKSKEDTRLFMDLITDYPINPVTKEPYGSNEFREKVHETINSSGFVVRLKDISSQFWDNENYLHTFCEKNEINLNSEFQATKSTLSRLKKYHIEEKKIKISYSYADIENGTIFAPEEENILVIDSKELREKFLKLKNENS